MPRVEASWVLQDQDLGAFVNTQRSRALCAARWICCGRMCGVSLQRESAVPRV